MARCRHDNSKIALFLLYAIHVYHLCVWLFSLFTIRFLAYQPEQLVFKIIKNALEFDVKFERELIFWQNNFRRLRLFSILSKATKLLVPTMMCDFFFLFSYTR